MIRIKPILLFSLVAFNSVGDQVETVTSKVPLFNKGATTFYVSGKVNDLHETEFMVDTGSGYSTINAQIFDDISSEGKARFVKSVVGILADGSEISMPIYRIARLNIGGGCVIRDIEFAVLPGQTRNILGLSALKKTAPFSMHVDPPTLVLSNCETSRART